MFHDDEFYDSSGRRVPRHEALDSNGTIKPGISMRTSMYAMDGLQRAVAEDGKRRKAVARDPLGRLLSEVEEEEDERDEPPRRHRTHGPMVDAATGFFDSRGVHFPPDQRLVDAQRATEYLAGRDEALRQMWRDGYAGAEVARQQMIDEGSNAWRNRSGERPTDAAPPSPRRIMSMADGQRLRDQAYRQMVEDGANAWRRGK